MGRHKKFVEKETPPTELPPEETYLPTLPDVSPIEEITRAEIDTQIATAKKYPRSVQRFRRDALSLATCDVGIAGQCFYKLQRKSKEGIKIIEGPSVRLAEICANAWGNMRFGARIVGEDQKCVVAQGVAHDLEKNVSDTIEVSRRITDKYGHRFSEDMVQVTKNAACSIALRNAIFKTIPFAYVKPIYEQAIKVAVGNIKTLNARKAEMVKAFSGFKITVPMLENFLGKSLEDAGLGDIENLIGAYNAIKDGDTTVAEQFNIRSKGETPMPQKKSESEASGSEADDLSKVQDSWGK